MTSRFTSLLLVAACGGADSSSPITDAPSSDSAGNDAAPSCGLSVTFEPPMPFAFPGSRTRAVAHVTNAPGVLAYTWQVKRNGTTITFDTAAPDGSAVEFDTEIANPYETLVSVTGTPEFCPSTPFGVNVGVPGANSTQVRMRVYPPPNIAAPPSERLVLVSGGANQSAGVVSIDPGVVATGSASVQAYLRFIPLSARDAYVEGFSSAAGAFSVRVLNQAHDVLVVPLVAGMAPRLVTNWLPGMNVTVNAGNAITGVVRDQAAALLANAKVQLFLDGVPTSLTTTDSSGQFTVRSAAMAGATTIEVTPPASSGLPKLVAASSSWNLAQQVQVAYDGGLVIRDLVGAAVKRSGVNQGNAQVTITGTIAAAGTITTGATVVPASGELRATATANGSGILPTLRAPDELLSAVTKLGAGDVAISTCDLRATAPATIDAPAMQNQMTQLRDDTGAALANAVFEAVPKGALGMAGVGSVRVIADGSGNVIAPLAPNGLYDLQFSDPLGRAAPATDPDVTVGGVDPGYNLAKAIRVNGSLSLAGNPQKISSASVQILCAVGPTCVGTQRALPLAEGLTGVQGDFNVAVTDPGTM